MVTDIVLRSLEDIPTTEYTETPSVEEISHDEALFLMEQAQTMAINTEDEISATEPAPITLQMLPPRIHQHFDNQDTSEPVIQKTSSILVDEFHLLLGLWCIDTKISRSQYQALVELLQTLKNISPISSLPKSLTTLKSNCKGQIPQIPLRRVKIPVIPEKLPTLSAADRILARATATWMYILDPVILLSTLIKSSQFMSRLHCGLAHFVDRPSELWHGWAWGTSIRTTSGEFAHYTNGQPIFPSDFVYYRCGQVDCECIFIQKTHLGRILCVGKNYTSRASTDERGKILLQVQVLISSRQLTPIVAELLQKDGQQLLDNEYIIDETKTLFLSEHQIISHEPGVFLDYQYQDGLHSRVREPADKLLVRRIADINMQLIRPLSLSSPLRGELELQTYGRQHLLNLYHNSPRKCVSIPYQLFIDGFGLYRSVYRSLMGIYLIPAGLTAEDRKKRQNLYPVTLGPHATNFHDVIMSLNGLTELDHGTTLNSYDVDGNTVSINAFCLAFLGDMPQQNENAGFKHPTATHSCRQCLVSETDRSNLDYDIVKMGRYHYQTKDLRDTMSSKSPKQKERFCMTYGLSPNPSPLLKIAPSLHLINSFPSDPAHSEYAGITKLAHSLLLEHILSPSGTKKYLAILQHFPFPNGWRRLQSPVTHLDSYQLQEHARASIIIPLVLRCHLQQNWMKKEFYEAISTLFDPQDYRPEDIVVSVFAAIAKSNSTLAWPSMSAEDRAQLKPIIVHARSGLQHLIQAAVIASEEIRPAQRATSVASTTAESQRSTSVPLSQVSVWSSRPRISKKSQKLVAMQGRPNMHIGLHYPAQAKDYAVPNNCNVLAGEDKHR